MPFFGIQSQIKRVMAITDLDKRRDALLKLGDELGCSRSSLWEPVGDNVKFHEDEMLRRIHEAARQKRESFVWVATALSALASVISAATALIALLLARGAH
jgi:hypothetical protein